MADGVLTSSLEKAWGKLFFGTQVCRKTGGHVLTPDFDMVENIIKKALNRKVLKVRKLRIVKRKNFDIWAIVIRSHLEGRSCVRSTQILYSEYYSADYAPKMASYGKHFYTDCLRLVETIYFDIRNF